MKRPVSLETLMRQVLGKEARLPDAVQREHAKSVGARATETDALEASESASRSMIP
jgi:hypothetical protein